MAAKAVIDARLVILKQIGASPGIRYRELLRSTGLGNGVLEHHLKILEDTHKVKVDRSGHKKTGFYSTDILDNESNILAAIRNNVSRQIVIFIIEHDLCTFNEILKHTEKAPSTLSWHLKRLSKASIISVTYGREYLLYQVVNSNFVEAILYKYRDSLENRL